MRRLFMFLFGLCPLIQAHAFPCYITLVKDSCWSSYSVSVDAVDVVTQKVLATMSMPEGKSWDRKEFDCQPEQTIKFKATYSPAFWEKDKDKVYSSKRDWSFPEAVNKGDAAWNMSICFTSDFQGVALPPEVSGQCICDSKIIPVIEPR